MPRRQKRFDRKGKSSIEGFEGDVNSRAVGEAKKNHCARATISNRLHSLSALFNTSSPGHASIARGSLYFAKKIDPRVFALARFSRKSNANRAKFRARFDTHLHHLESIRQPISRAQPARAASYSHLVRKFY